MRSSGLSRPILTIISCYGHVARLQSRLKLAELARQASNLIRDESRTIRRIRKNLWAAPHPFKWTR
ncbi:hypothetical protein L249_1397 [Ophiocordyceps polyrhachis-furcata BCC 54312]|uniref:Uncharacterized protein n=1 Tax=Ophiocordyceps polyrhachis-furcata BCC 54312 TaxID=1330021 RepID=A0A367L490_9HYPO|nr:hypothetical protein L249_1397 [Ophiocordyceps polyrhachis-furcata BCC 54312]